jgi:UDP-3-O-[3-hydroxymyristoyl] N-acetylglucosamine deacetylase/3-hydroxyacyl-[acyl-carrier-protein] dehydratase
LNQPQKTIARETVVSGRGLFTGCDSQATFSPAPVGHGVVFVRTDLQRPVRMPALVEHITKRARRSTLRSGPDSLETIEHCMSAVAGLGIDNIQISVAGGELPGVDGSCLPFVEALEQAGIVEQELPRPYLRISEPIEVTDGSGTLIAAPPAGDEFQIIFDLDYGPGTVIGKQLYSYRLGPDFSREIAPARTFVLEEEAQMLRSRGLGLHLKPGDVVVVGANGPIGTDFRFADECVRHKVLDLIGDLYLLGCPIRGRIVAYKSGHALNHALVRHMRAMLDAHRNNVLLKNAPVMDIRTISKILPHRYPMLLVDRVIEMDGDRRAVGIKNVTFNEPFLQGHYPGQPVMPGVLIVEAMAQLSGLLLSHKLEHTGKVALLMSLDKVKVRRPVVPGDQLVMEAENIRVKARTGHVRASARVGDQLAAEAIIKFMIVDEIQ